MLILVESRRPDARKPGEWQWRSDEPDDVSWPPTNRGLRRRLRLVALTKARWFRSGVQNLIELADARRVSCTSSWRVRYVIGITSRVYLLKDENKRFRLNIYVSYNSSVIVIKPRTIFDYILRNFSFRSALYIISRRFHRWNYLQNKYLCRPKNVFRLKLGDVFIRYSIMTSCRYRAHKYWRWVCRRKYEGDENEGVIS